MKKWFLGLIFMAIAILSAFSFIGCKNSSGLSNSRLNDYFYDEDVFHDQAYTYIAPLQPTSEDNVTLRLKVKRGLAKKVDIKYSFDISSSASDAEFYTAPMVFETTDINSNYDFWIGIIPANEANYRYHFELTNNRETVWYDLNGIGTTEPYSVSGDWYVLTDFYVPEWSQGAVWYSIMPDSYYNANTLNDKVGSGIDNPWGTGIHSGGAEYFGGDIYGLLAQIDYLKGLNITSLFINPIWVTQHNAGYGAYDLLQIDSAYGNDEVFGEFVNSLHDDDIKLMLDAVIQYVNINNIVYNYTGRYPDIYDGGDVAMYDDNGNPVDSGWGGPIVDFSKKIAREYFYSAEESVLLTYILKYSIDGWRMDVGNTLTGSDPKNWGTSTQILADIRRYIKNASREVLYLTEHAVATQLSDGTVDSKWNYAFENAVEQWVTDISNAGNLATALKSEFSNMPRNVANASYNHLTSHDYARLYDKVGCDPVKFGAAELIQMTYVGSPVIYYGEEIGLSRSIENYMSRPNSFDVSMNWDESTWNYELLNLTKALTELRREYSEVYSTGALMDLYYEGVNNPNNIYAYARFAEETCITLTNKNNMVVKDFELDVSRLSLKNGTVLTDYLTGRKYTVKDGKIKLDINPIGAVLVTGKAGGYRNGFEIFGNDNTFSVTAESKNEYVLSGNGKLNNSKEFSYIGAKSFNNCAINANVVSSSGEICVMLCGDESASEFYGVKIKNNKLTLAYLLNGEYSEGDTVSVASGATITVARTDNNICRVYVNGEEINGFARYTGFGYEIYLCCASLGGSTDVILGTESLTEQTGDEYEVGIGSYAILKGDIESVSVDGGKLILSGVEDDSFVLSRAHYTDFTHKAMIDYTPVQEGSFAGLTVFQSNNDFIVAGRYNDGTKVKFFVGQVLNSKLCVYSLSDNVEGRVTLQLQKSGALYTALYSIDGKSFIKFGEIYVNYSDIYAGLMRSGKDTLSAEYWCFGESVKSEDLADHYFEGEIPFGIQYSYKENSFSTVNGEWGYVAGGIAQTDDDAVNVIYNYRTTEVTDFSATYTINVNKIRQSEKSYTGFAFARRDLSVIDGYQLRIYSDGTVRLSDKNGIVLAEGVTSLKANEKLQFTVVVRGEMFVLYEGNDPSLVLYYYGLADNFGYFGWISNNAAFELYNYNIFMPTGNVIMGAGSAYNYGNEVDFNLTDVELSSSTYNYLTYKNIGVSDFAVSYNLLLTRINMVRRGYVDFSFGVSVGSKHLATGITVRINTAAKLSVIVDGEEVVSDITTAITNTSSCYILIAYQNKVLKVYTANYDPSGNYSVDDLTLEFTYNDKKLHSGSISLFSYNANAKFAAMRGKGLSENEDYFQLDFCNEMVLSEPMPDNPDVGVGEGTDYRNDFENKSSFASILNYSGSNYIKDGCLIIDGYNPINWDAGCAIPTGKYKNFELKMRFKMVQNVGGGAWVGVSFAKNVATGGNRAVMIVYPGNYCEFYYNGTLTGTATTGVADTDGFVILTLKVLNNVVTWDLGEKAVQYRIPNDENLTGYISLQTGSDICCYDWVEIKVLSDT